MEIVLGMYRLRDPGGTEHYTLIAAERLQRLVHSTTIFTEELGVLAELAPPEGAARLKNPTQLTTTSRCLRSFPGSSPRT